jgi:hypothetical protein
MEVRTEPEKSLLAVLEDAVLDCELTEHVGHFTDMHEFSHQGVHYGFAIVRTADDVLEIWIQRRRYVTENYLPKAVR